MQKYDLSTGNMKKNKEPQQRYYYNEHDQNQVSQLYTQRRKKKRKIRIKRILFIVVVIAVLGFFISPHSRVGKINIKGMSLLNESEILKVINVKETSIHMLVSSSSIEKKLEEHGLIEDAMVSKGLFNTLDIEVKEAKPIAFQELEDKIALIGSDGNIYYTSSDKLSSLSLNVHMANFSDEKAIETFGKEYIKITESVRSLISEIVFDPVEPYDAERIKFIMEDGKIIYVRLEDMAGEMKYYQEVLSTKPDGCVYDIHGKNVYVTECD